MRILTVSAHYPPNFVSGGTLQPQRLAQGLAGRGHNVSVYAGWLGDRPPLSTWEDTDETGMAVRWIVTTPWTAWDDERNWHNPAVTDDFRAHVRRLAPDVVHFHSMQSLGAGLLPAARSAGAKVVVTMHDFWWICSRQFLVDRDLRPCSLVVEAGVCPCAVDEEWRRRRAEALAALLESADVVLAPSHAAARVLEANGVAPDRLQVDENGLPDEVMATLGRRGAVRAAPEPDPDHVVRFLYAGGPDPLKGVDVVLDAADRLSRRPPTRPWRLSAYGVEPGPPAGRAKSQALVDRLDAFDPGELGAVLAAHDVLVLPSVARETHSLLTREALAAGLPVVCSDAPGPEEVVRDGDNGLVVPAGEPAALAGALARVLDEGGLLDRLRAGAAEPQPARSLDEQVESLDTLLRGLVARPAGSTTRVESTVRSVVFGCGIEGAPLRYRARLPAESLGRLGVRTRVLHYRHPDLLAAASQADAVVLYRVPATVQVLELIETLHGAGIPVAFDVDDLIVDPDLQHDIPALSRLPRHESALWVQGVERYRTTLEACDVYIGSTDMLVDEVARLTGLPTHRFDNGVGLELARAADRARRRPRRAGRVRIGYLSGTVTHDDDWFHVEPAVVEVLGRHPDVELWLGGHLPATPRLEPYGDRVVRLPFMDWLDLPGVLRDLDVNLAPLEPGRRFNEAKSAIKWLEAALCATPTVASPTGPFRQAVDDGRTGVLADTPDEWTEALERLVTDADARARIGAAARRDALLEWSPARQGRRYLTILEQLVETGPLGPRASSWVPVVLDEPAISVELEPYGPAPDSAPVATTPAPPRWAAARDRVSDLARRGRASLRRDGAAATALKFVDKATGKVKARFGR